MRDLLVQLGRIDQRLGWDAANVEANPARLVPFDQQSLLAQLPEPDAGHIAAWSGANDKSVHAQRFHVELPYSSDVRAGRPALIPR